VDRDPFAAKPVAGCLVIVGAISLVAGALLAYVYVVGFGIVDTWIIYPGDITWLHWLVPGFLIAWPICFALWLWRQARRGDRPG
jgi:hypothetical protein